LNTDTWKAAVEHTFDWYKGFGVIPKVLRCDADRIPEVADESNEFRRWLMSRVWGSSSALVALCALENAVERDAQTIVAGVASFKYV
jgi:hypothetical protein